MKNHHLATLHTLVLLLPNGELRIYLVEDFFVQSKINVKIFRKKPKSSLKSDLSCSIPADPEAVSLRSNPQVLLEWSIPLDSGFG